MARATDVARAMRLMSHSITVSWCGRFVAERWGGPRDRG